MNIDIRKYIINNFKGSSENDIKDSINNSIKDNSEEALPGLGVLFEIIWKNSDNSTQNTMIQNAVNHLKNES